MKHKKTSDIENLVLQNSPPHNFVGSLLLYLKEQTGAVCLLPMIDIQ